MRMSTVRSRLAIGMLGCAIALGCAANRDTGPGPDPSASTAPRGPSADPGVRERVVRVAMRVRVSDVVAAVRVIRSAVSARDGYVERGSAEGERAHFELRVPSAELDALRPSLAALGEVELAEESVEDVTAAHADQAARIASAHAEEARLMEMFATRTDDLADVLAVERELSRVREQIETQEAQERVLREEIAMARISLDLVRDVPGLTSEPLAFLGASATTGVQVTSTLGLAALGALLAFGPSALALLALALLARTLVRRLRARAAT